MNTELLERHCGIRIPNINRKALRYEEIALTDQQKDRLLAWNKRINRGIVKTIRAYWVTYKRQRTKTIMVEWSEAMYAHYFTQEEYERIVS